MPKGDRRIGLSLDVAVSEIERHRGHAWSSYDTVRRAEAMYRYKSGASLRIGGRGWRCCLTGGLRLTLVEDDLGILCRGAIEQRWRLTLELFVEEGDRVRIGDLMHPLAADRPTEAHEWGQR